MRRIVLLLALLVPGTLFAQCGATPYFLDQSEKQVMQGRIDPQWAAPMANLQSQGAEIITYVAPATQNLDQSVLNLVRACPLWTSGDASGTRFDQVAKSTLIVLAFSPQSHLSGLYYGAAWHHALDGQWNRIRTDYMNPRFKQSEWAGALAAGMQQLNARVLASKDEALHPAVSTTTYQATDLKPIARLGMYILFAIVGALGLFFVVHMLIENRKRKRELAQARDEAITARAKVSRALILLKDLVAEKPQQADWDAISDSFNKYNSGSRNPDDETLPLFTYQTIRKDYDAMANKLGRINRDLTSPEDLDEESMPVYPEPTEPLKAAAARHTSAVSSSAGGSSVGSDGRRHHRHSSTNVFAPVIIGSIGSGPAPYEEPTVPAPTSSPSPSWEPPAPDPEPEPSHDDGGSSSWSAPDSSPSTDFGGGGDSGGSSSFDSGSSSSDSGGSGSW